MKGMGVAVPCKYEEALTRCGFKCSELLPQQMNNPVIAKKIVYVHTKGQEGMARVMEMVRMFKIVEDAGATADGLISAAIIYGYLPREPDASPEVS